MRNLKGRRVLITGGAGGIGLQTALAFAREGAEIVLTDINEEALQKAAREVEAAGARVHLYRNDVTDYGEVEALARRVASEVGEVDVLVNNAGIGFSAELKDTTLEQWGRLLAINVMGPIHFVHAFLPSMLARKQGSIVNVSSGQAFFPIPTWGAYAATKWCLAAYSEVLHYELARHGIEVTTVFPYVVNSPFYSDIQAETFGSRMVMKLIPFYAVSPERTGRIILGAVKKGKKNEMHHPFNKLIYYFSRFFSPVVDQTGHTLAWALTRGKRGRTQAAPEKAAAPPAAARPAAARGRRAVRGTRRAPRAA